MRQPWAQWRSVRSILRTIHDFAPDVVHFQQGHFWFNFAIPHLRKHYPLVLTIHDPRHHAGDKVSQKTPQWIMDFAFRRADHVIVHGRALAQQVCELFGHSPENVHVIPHVVMGEPSSTPSGPPAASRILFFGRIWPYKGLDTLIKAEPMITEQFPEMKIVIGGTGEDFAHYENMMVNREQFEVHHRWISDEERAAFFDECSLVVLPYNEATQSGVIPVAYNHYKPVVATDVGALADCVVHGETGLLVPPKDPSALAAAICQLLREPKRCHAMGLRAFEYIQSTASPMAVARKTAEVYTHAIGKEPSRSSLDCEQPSSPTLPAEAR